MQPAISSRSRESQDAGRDVRIAVKDGELAVSVVGEGPPLLLLHAWTLDHRMWMPQVAALGLRFSLIMPDRRGFGRSAAPPDLTEELTDIARIADALGHERLAIAGVSQGGAVALAFGIASPDRVTGLILSGAPLAGLVDNPDDIPRDRYAMLARRPALAQLREEWMAHPLMRLGQAPARALVRDIVADYQARDLLAPSALPPFTASDIMQLAMPLLAISGTGDTPWRIACARYLAEVAPRGSLVMLDETGHLPNIEQPAAFNAAIHKFLAST